MKRHVTSTSSSTLASFSPGDIVVLADPTFAGGTMTGRELPAGTHVRIAWFPAKDAASAHRVFVEPMIDGEWQPPAPVHVTARVERVVYSRRQGEAETGEDVDPLRGGARGGLL